MKDTRDLKKVVISGSEETKRSQREIRYEKRREILGSACDLLIFIHTTMDVSLRETATQDGKRMLVQKSLYVNR